MYETNGDTSRVEDPVCGMLIAPQSAAAKSFYEGKVIHFCSTVCKEKFDLSPESFKPATAQTAGHACCG